MICTRHFPKWITHQHHTSPTLYIDVMAIVELYNENSVICHKGEHYHAILLIFALYAKGVGIIFAYSKATKKHMLYDWIIDSTFIEFEQI